MKLGSVVISLFLMTLGASFLASALFGIEIPIFKVGLGLLFIFWGLTLISGSSLIKNDDKTNSSLFSKALIDCSDHRGTHFYNFYLSDITLRIPSNIPTRIILKSVASSIVLPAPHVKKDGSILINTQNDQNPELTLQVYTFAGSVQILQ